MKEQDCEGCRKELEEKILELKLECNKLRVIIEDLGAMITGVYWEEE